jgi:hypothetical protein
MKLFRKQIGGRTLLVPSIGWTPELEEDAHLKMRRDRKKWLRQWGWTQRGRDTLSDLIDRGYRLDLPHPIAGGGRNFDAVDDKVDRVSDDAVLDCDDTDSVALQALIKLDAVSTVARAVAGKKNAVNSNANAGYQLAFISDEIMKFAVADGTDGVQQASAAAMVAGTWYAFTGLMSAISAANDDIYLYTNATVSGPTNSTVMGSLANSRPFRAGSNSNATPGNFWDGDIAYVRAWIKNAAAWTANQRLQIVENRDRLYLPQDEFMELQWILWDAGTPTIANDYTDNSFDGTYTGTTFVEDPKRVYKAAINPERVQRVFAVAAFPELSWQGSHPVIVDMMSPAMIPYGPVPGSAS